MLSAKNEKKQPQSSEELSKIEQQERKEALFKQLGRAVPEPVPEPVKEKTPKYEDVALSGELKDPSFASRDQGTMLPNFVAPHQEKERLAAMVEARNIDQKVAKEIESNANKEPEIQKPKGFSLAD
jgi:hypothetical protein